MNGGVMHLQFASWRRLVAKHRWYKILERLKYPGKSMGEIDRTYSQALNEAGLEVKAAPAEWWEPYGDLRKHIDLSAKPWHEKEAERLINLHGREMFFGLDLFEEVVV